MEKIKFLSILNIGACIVNAIFTGLSFHFLNILALFASISFWCIFIHNIYFISDLEYLEEQVNNEK